MTEQINSNLEIDNALKEFEKQSQEQVHIIKGAMSTEEFGSDLKNKKIINLVIKFSGGLIKNQKQSIYTILGFVFIAIIISTFLFFKSFSNDVKSPSLNLINTPQPSQSLMPGQ